MYVCTVSPRVLQVQSQKLIFYKSILLQTKTHILQTSKYFS